MTELVPENDEIKRIVVATQDGVVSCLSVSRILGNLKCDKIWSLELKGTIRFIASGGVPKSRDKIFLVLDSMIVGISKKGKQFFSLETNLTDQIEFICVSNNYLSVCSRHTYIFYVGGVEKGFWYSEEEISHFDSPETKSIFDAVVTTCLKSLYLLRGSEVLIKIDLDWSLCNIKWMSDLSFIGTSFEGELLLFQVDKSSNLKLLQQIDLDSKVDCTFQLLEHVVDRNDSNIFVLCQDGHIRVLLLEGTEFRLTQSLETLEHDVRGVVYDVNFVLTLGFSGKLYSHSLIPQSKLLLDFQFKTKEEYVKAIDQIDSECKELSLKVSKLKDEKMKGIDHDSKYVKLPSVKCSFKFNYSNETDSLAFFFSSHLTISKVIYCGSNLELTSDSLQVISKCATVCEFSVPENSTSFSVNCKTTDYLVKHQAIWFVVYFADLSDFCWFKNFQVSPLHYFQPCSEFPSEALSYLRIQGENTLHEIHRWTRELLEGLPQNPLTKFPIQYHWKTDAALLKCHYDSASSLSFFL
jgi:hypothetical protein